MVDRSSAIRHVLQLAARARAIRSAFSQSSSAAEPERELLLSDASRPLQEQARRQAASRDGATEVLARSAAWPYNGRRGTSAR